MTHSRSIELVNRCVYQFFFSCCFSIDHFLSYVIEISFDTEAVEPYYYVYIVDIDNHNIEEDKSNPQDPYNLARAALEAEGKNAITMDELQILQDEKRQEIGFDDKLYYYGDELKPDEE